MTPFSRLASLLLVLTAPMLSGCTTVLMWGLVLEPKEPQAHVLFSPGGGATVVATYDADFAVLVPIEPDGTVAYPFGYAGAAEDLDGPRSLRRGQLQAIRSANLPNWDWLRTLAAQHEGELSILSIRRLADTKGTRELSKHKVVVFVLPGLDAGDGRAGGERVLLLPETHPLPPSQVLIRVGTLLMMTPYLLARDAFYTPAALFGVTPGPE